jgi:murein DD-endopeptidase MepM/ murein hydrolase activator NlpD
MLRSREGAENQMWMPPRSRVRIARVLAGFLAFLLVLGMGVLLVASVLLVGSAQARISYPDGAAEFHGHVFPVQGPHWTRGAIGDFGAPRDGGRTHEGFDIVAACGTPIVAVRGGRVRSTGYDPVPTATIS